MRAALIRSPVRRENQKIILVSGKGGVGKTAVAAAIALAQARTGKSVLLAELGERSFLRHVFPGAGTFKPVKVTDGLSVVRWDAEGCLREYLLHYLKIEKIVALFFANQVTQALIGAAPALRELALMGKITSGPRGIGPDLPYDVIVVDAYATGHFKALFMAPVGMSEAIRYGPMGEQSRNIIEVLKNPKVTRVVLVTLPEELPVNECGELHSFLNQKFSIDAGVVVNRNIELPLSPKEAEEVRRKFKSLAQPPIWSEELLEYLKSQSDRQGLAAKKVRQFSKQVLDLPWYFGPHWPELLRLMSHEMGGKWPAG